jgi:hypothetical protein
LNEAKSEERVWQKLVESSAAHTNRKHETYKTSSIVSIISLRIMPTMVRIYVPAFKLLLFALVVLSNFTPCEGGSSRSSVDEAYAMLVGPRNALSYLSLLNLNDEKEVTEVIRQIHSSCHSSIHDDDDAIYNAVRILLEQRDWRMHLVAAVAVYLCENVMPLLIEATWEAFDNDSWVTPQLAVILSLVDTQFHVAAIERLKQNYILHQEQQQLDDEELEDRNLYRRYINYKALDSLVQLLKIDGYHADSTPDEFATLSNFVLKVTDPDDANGGQIAVGWRRRFLEIAAAILPSYPEPAYEYEL